ncbi:LOW QUALITY PROTEIN: regulatory-associated protein of mTOR-like [Liolophura sinensis]|uniref:LOW QUALITY PROTEIN: regulatory-associated protein of mTOR-like n=1 Tax=Liolophura sinensis TaxID=3198878 RepID=UPI00315917A2
MMTGELDFSVFGDEEDDVDDWDLPLAFTSPRHTEKIQGPKTVTQTWRMKERMKTVSVALVLCLNVGVDPPDIVKTTPCARLECWLDPLSMSPHKALEGVGANLQKQYERWQPRARYKQSLDPTVDEVKKLCSSLRRNAKEERVLFHYNGHGVPRPTVNGEIWVFNKSYTQYIPLSIYDLQSWMGSPSIYVYDCSNAGVIVESFKQFSQQREQEIESVTQNGGQKSPSQFSTKHCIQLAACGTNELLPMNPELPADLFTSCLTTPIKIALKWYVLQNTDKLVPGLTLDMVDKVPGQLNDRRTMLGELNWIFTAITDTVAWNTLPRAVQRLFRQDLLVASLFRNFLLAERIMRSYNCTPVSSPNLPSTYQHPMWNAWDLALDQCLSQLPHLLESEDTSFKHSPFFAEQLTAFQVWLSYGSESRSPPEQLPIVLQVLLSQVHRLRALDLLGRFLDLGPWAVSLALSVGIFPYVLKLLQSSARELRPLLVFIWAKILAVDSSCQADLVKDNGHKYFLSVLADPYMPAEHRTMAAFVLAMIVNEYQQGQEAALQGNLISICLEQLTDSHSQLRQWLAICLGKVWTQFDPARWCGVRDSAHEKLHKMLSDPIPEVRAAAVFALGTFISNCTQRSDHANNIDLGVGMKLIGVLQDGSPLVRKELAVAFSGLVVQFESQFAAIAHQFIEEERTKETNSAMVAAVPGGWNLVTSGGSSDGLLHSGSLTIKRTSSKTSLKGFFTSPAQTVNIMPVPPIMTYSSSGSFESSGSVDVPSTGSGMRRVSSSSSIAGTTAVSLNNVYANVWKALIQLTLDPSPDVAELSKDLVNGIKLKAMVSARPKQVLQNSSSSHSAPSSPSTRPSHLPESPPHNGPPNIVDTGGAPTLHSPTRGGNPAVPYSTQFSRSRKIFDKGPNLVNVTIDEHEEENAEPKWVKAITTDFFQWCCRQFARPVKCVKSEKDPESVFHQQRQFRFMRNRGLRAEGREEQRRAGFNRLDDQIFVNRNPGVPCAIKFHGYEPHLAVADREGVSIWDWESGTKLSYLQNDNPKHSKITCMEYMNAHDIPLLMCGSDDGTVRVWRNFVRDSGEAKELVTSFQALSDMLPLSRGAGMVADWEQGSGILLTSGDVRIVRVWDTSKEMKVQDIPTGADSCVSSLACDSLGRSLLIAGCGDGTVRLFDRRMAPAECRVMTMREHNGWVVKTYLQRGTEGKIISASVSGDVRFWDPRFTESIKTITFQQGMTSLEIHPYADVLACGSVNQYITVFNQSGDTLSTMKYHEGFMGQRIGPISCMAFHPHRVKLGAASTDSFISVYSTPDTKKR